MTEAENESQFVLTKDTPYLAFAGELWDVFCEILETYDSVIMALHWIPYLTLTGQLWDVCCEDLGENWQHYNVLTWVVLG